MTRGLTEQIEPSVEAGSKVAESRDKFKIQKKFLEDETEYQSQQMEKKMR